MIDGEDVEFAILAFNPTSIGGLIFAAVVVGLIAWAACDNAKDCAMQKCEHGVPRLVDNACLCVEAPK